jgi:TonB family protein
VPGPGGEAYANYADFVEMFYRGKWSPPSDLADNKAVVSASVVILRSGKVASFTIVKRSRNAALDDSVDRLRKLDFVAPFPEGARDEKRTFNINFILHSEP